MLNKVKQGSNMYQFCTHTWNPIQGCLHDCIYCYLKAIRYNMEPRFNHRAMKDDLGAGNTVFVGSAADMWGRWVKYDDIKAVLDKCKQYAKNTFFFQTKDPGRYFEFRPDDFPTRAFLGTTIETNHSTDDISKAPLTLERKLAMVQLREWNIQRFITIEPVMDFDLNIMIGWMQDIKPDYINIGADSKGYALREPPPGKLRQLIDALEGISKVRLKSNIKRLLTS